MQRRTRGVAEHLWRRLLTDYEASARARGLSPRTIDGYAMVLGRILLPFCARWTIQRPSDLTSRQLSLELQERGLRRPSVRSYLAAVNHFLRWAYREGEIPRQVLAPQLRQERILIDVLTREEIDLLEVAAGTEREKLIVRVLADTGIRLGELRALEVSDLIHRGAERYLRVRGKGQRQRLVPTHPSLFRRLERYVAHTRPRAAGGDWLFSSPASKSTGDAGPPAEGPIQHLVRRLATDAGIHKRVYPHLLRHSFATHMLHRGMNPIQLRNILGHSSLAMLDRVYSHLVPSDAYSALVKAFRRSS